MSIKYLMKKSELKKKWEKEKEVYKTQKVGSGVQTFVKDILQSEDLFSLKRGLKSTPPERRKNEFLEQEKTKKSGYCNLYLTRNSNSC